MLKKDTLSFLLISSILVSSCGTSRQAANRTKTDRSPITITSTGDAELDYINTYRDIAISEMERTGVPASITLAQGMVESNYGRSELARKANNHFGIKCHNWTGPVVYHDDDRKNDCFRKYKSPEESFRDHSDFLKNGSRYSFLFNLSTADYEGWARGLKKAGYATNPDYANMIIRKIEEANLAAYDKGYTAEKRAVRTSNTRNPVQERASEVTASLSEGVTAKAPRVMVNNRVEYIIVKDGDTREDLEEKFNLLRWELPRYNELENDFRLSPGQILYLQPKRDKADAGKENYVFSEGDSMYSVSQKFGVKLKSLYEMNRMSEGTQPEPGTKLWLRSMKPVN